MKPSFTSVVVPDEAPPGNPVDPDFLTHLSDRLGAPPEGSPPPPQVPVIPQGEPVTPASPVVPAAEPVVPKTPVTTEPGPPRETAVRIENKELKTRLETYEKELAELREKAGKLPELETSLTETRTLAEQREAERLKLESAYRNEVTTVPEALLDEIPEFVEARGRFEEKAKVLFPEYVSDPDDDADPDIPFRFQNLPQPYVHSLGGYLDQYESTLAEPNQIAAAETRRALISSMAKVMGVRPEKFVTEAFRGKDFEFLPKTHPVYKHLRGSIEPFLQQRDAMNRVRGEALKNSEASVQKAASGRIDNTRQLFKNFGVSLSGEELDQALAKAPDNITLQAVKALQGHPDLLEEVKANLEHEAIVNGHFRPVLDIHDLDPASRTAKADATRARIGKRAAYAPIVEPLIKLLLRNQSKLTELEKAKAEAEAEAARARANTEPGAGGGYEGSAEPDTGTGNAYYDGLKAKLPR